MDPGLAKNGFARRTLHLMEAILLAQAGYPCPPDTRPPHYWVLSNGGVPVLPVPREGAAFDREVEAVRASMTEEERNDPKNAPGNVAAWTAYFEQRRAQVIASTNGL